MSSVIYEKGDIDTLPSKALDNSHDSLQPIDRALEKKVIRKCDLHLVPILMALFLCAFVDRRVTISFSASYH